MAAPKANNGAGTSKNTATPKIVAPTGSSRAMAAVSKDLRFDNEEKYSVWAIAVGIKPNPSSISEAPIESGSTSTALRTGTAKITAKKAVNAYKGSIIETMLI